MTPTLLDHLALFGAGLLAGVVNVLAGGGSFLTLPLMIFLGLPATVANGTNRIAILAQNVAAVSSFQRRRLVEWGRVPGAVVPAVAGALLGAWGALVIGDRGFERALSVIMVAVALWTLWDPLGVGSASGGEDDGPAPGDRSPLGRGARTAAWFAAGVYGGFVQAGLGFLILAITTASGLDLVRGNALKVVVVLLFTPLVLLLFGMSGKVAWGLGAALAGGTVLGALAGVRLAVWAGHERIRRIVLVAIVVFAVLLWT